MNDFKLSYLRSVNADYIDLLLEQYQQDPNSVDESWRYFFEGMELGAEIAPEVGHPYTNGANGHAAAAPAGLDLLAEARVYELVRAYRAYGHLLARINPLEDPPARTPELELATHGLTDGDLGKTFQAGKLIGLGPATLKQIIEVLRETYCGTVTVETAHIHQREAREWLNQKVESARGRPKLDAATQKFILKRLVETETFERFLHTRYVAQKRFSIEGGDAAIPALDCMIETGASLGAEEFVLGMAHRGRLNVLVNLCGKKHEQLLLEFEGTYKVDTSHGEGDVKYHKGYSADLTTRQGKKAHLSLAYNPSHLEFVNPVIEGIVRAKQSLRAGASAVVPSDAQRQQVVPIQIHGDAAFAGQGTNYETLNFSKLPGYATGGTLHIVINNQVGFTTSPHQARSTRYCTDLAKMLDGPIFHVNGDDAEAVWWAAQICTEFRQKFGSDTFIDLLCYRKHGHNEGDEPSFTQPQLYKKIKAHQSPREVYQAKLAAAGVQSDAETAAEIERYTGLMTAAQTAVRAQAPELTYSAYEGKWAGLKSADESDLHAPSKTAVDAGKLRALAEKLNTLPGGFTVHPKLARFFEARLKAVQEGKGIDWGNGEALAYATLVTEGHRVRITGQDAERGTFTHRHSVLNDFETGKTHTPLNNLSPDQAKYEVHNSLLSETAVMAFEYGYSMADPSALVIWEAQFGDFSNGAQVIIDQFISTSESKWHRSNGLVLLLPHGFEGQGPEHSSARLERFLQLCGRNNMTVANLTTPAQIFHALRRQVTRPFRKPLVVMSPKSLLRHPMAVSTLDEFAKQGFQEVLSDPLFATPAAATSAKKVLMCSGKVYYDLVAERAARKLEAQVAIIRLEQFYPWPGAKLAEALGGFTGVKEFTWVQEEPRNMGGWTFVLSHWAGGYEDFAARVGGRPLKYAGRELAAAPAVGSAKVHEQEQKALIDAALSGAK